MLGKINLQLFAEDTIPEKEEEKNFDNNSTGDPFAGLDERIEKRQAKLDNEATPEKEKPKEEEPEKPKEEEPETKEPEKEEVYEIVHLGKKVTIPAADRDKYLQMGYDYGHVKEEATKAKTTLQRIAKLEGFDKVDDYVAELDNKEKARLAEQIEEAGSDTEKIDEIIENHPMVRQTKEERQRLDNEKRKLEYQGKIDSLKGEQFYNDLKPELDQLLEQNPNTDPAIAYTFLLGNYVKTGKMNELIKTTKEKAEKKVVADIHDKERRATPTGGDADEGKDYVHPTALGNKLAGVFGLSKDATHRAAQRTREKLKRS